MEALGNCFVEELRNPVKFIDLYVADESDTEEPPVAAEEAVPAPASIPAPAPAPAPATSATPATPASSLPQLAVRERDFSNLAQLNEFLDSEQALNYSTRFISICQRTSWRPLQITKPMLESIVEAHDIDASFWEVPSCFYNRSLKLEETFCVPLSKTQNGPWTEISYTLRYPELKQNEEDEYEWAIRQTGLYHRFHEETRQNLFVLVSPTVDSKVHALARELLAGLDPRTKDLFWLHEALFSAHTPAWRQYVAAQELTLLKIANSTFSTFIDEELSVGYDSLSTLASVQVKFLQAVTLLNSTQAVLDEVVAVLGAYAEEDEEYQRRVARLGERLRGCRRQCAAYASQAVYLRQRTETTAQLLANTLSYRDQVISKEQNTNMLKLNKSAVFITMVTLIYVPASFVATFFGMNFFAMDATHHRIVGTRMIWIYVVTTLALTAVSIVFYYWLVQHEGMLFWHISPKVRRYDWRGLNFNVKRRGTMATMATEMTQLTGR